MTNLKAKKFYVYEILCLVNNKRYIGETYDLKRRWRQHANTAISNAPSVERQLIHNAILKYGIDKFQFSIIEECNSEEEALHREEQWVRFYRTCVPIHGDEFGYNLTMGGKKLAGECNPFYGKKHSDATISILSEKKKEWHLTNANPMQGKHHTDETKKQLSISHIGILAGEKHPNFGKQLSEETKGKISLRKNEKFDFYSDLNKGSKNPASKLDENQIMDIVKLITDGIKDKEISKQFGVNRECIKDIRLGRAWAWLTGFDGSQNKRVANSKLNEEDVVQIKKLIVAGTKLSIIAELYSINPATVSGIKRGKRWAHVKI